ncbi:MAG: RHS repeat domain-containing protein [Gaiella sp.]
MWAKRGTVGQWQTLLTTTANTMSMGFNYPANEFGCWNGTTAAREPVATTDSNWHHWVCTFDVATGYLRLYKDGAFVISVGGVTSWGNSSETLVIGAKADGSTAFLGTMDEAAMYVGTALSAGQVYAHYSAATLALPAQAYAHRAYDANGNLSEVTLPSTSATLAGVAATDKTSNAYWDDGSIYWAQDPVFPKVRYEYAAEGWQTVRVPETAQGSTVLDTTKWMSWQHTPDGLSRALSDIGGQRAIYAYDANGNRLTATEADGLIVPGQSPLTVNATYSEFDEPLKIRVPKTGSADWYSTEFIYDFHGNTTVQIQNEVENTGGGTVTAGRQQTFAYNETDEPVEQIDDYGTAAGTDDERFRLEWTKQGWEAKRVVEKAASPWTVEQDTTLSYYRNGLEKTRVSTDGAPSPVTLESHSIRYIAGGVYLNGNKTSDDFKLVGPASAPTSCQTVTCTQSWLYDARERAVLENNGTGTGTEFTLDTVGNVTQEKQNGTVTRSATYSAQQLTTETVGGTTKRFIYDALGNQDCVTPSAYSGGCPVPGVNLYTDNLYDYKNRLLGYRNYNLTTTAVDSADYVNDPLDRPIQIVEKHGATTTTTSIVYVGISDAVAVESLTGGVATTKKYAYDPLGRRVTFSDGTNRFSYLNDPYGSVSVLIDQARVVKESYGYTAYGNANTNLTKTTAGFNGSNVPQKNLYRFSSKRWDSGSSSYDMGFRRYSASTGRFFQRDQYDNALDNLGLSEDPLTGNRYGMAAGNPVNFVEVDGHKVACMKCGVSIWRAIAPKAVKAAKALKSLFKPQLRTTAEVVGKTDGGPGKWAKRGGNAKGSAFEEQVSGVQKGVQYVVRANGQSAGFDDFVKSIPGRFGPIRRGTLIDAKDWSAGGIMDKALRNQSSVIWDKMLKQALRQEAVSGKNQVKWVFSDKAVMARVEKALRANGVRKIKFSYQKKR